MPVREQFGLDAVSLGRAIAWNRLLDGNFSWLGRDLVEAEEMSRTERLELPARENTWVASECIEQRLDPILGVDSQ